MVEVVSVDVARGLAAAGLAWVPRPGDRFVIPGQDMDDELFHVAEMTIEVHTHHGEEVVKFNGTTEWALDSIPASEVLWLPREGQLRAALGEAFVALERDLGEWVVTYRVGGANRRVRDPDVEDAYARGLLDLLLNGGG